MVHFPYICFWKIGITGVGAITRAKWIDKAMFGFPIPVFVVWIPGAYVLEQSIHGWLKPLNVNFYQGDGHTEWFWFPCVMFALPLMMGIWGLYCLGADAILGTDSFGLYIAALVFVGRYFAWAILFMISKI